jgi:L-alanine-DL-glutamate epimerase-like enolase superfamily enzyme
VGFPIDVLQVTGYAVPTDAPEADGTLAWNTTTMVLVEVCSGDIRGTGWTYGSPACARVVIDELADIVLAADALDVGATFDKMVKAVRNAPRPGVVGYAISAVDTALWDLKARLLGLPLHRLLGALHDSAPVYGSGGFTSYDERQLRDQLKHWTAEQRIPRVKIKIGESWGSKPTRDLERMAQARDEIGPDVELFVDANGGYHRKQAIRMMRATADLDIRWLEEPVSSDDLAGLREVRDAVAPDVTAGEYGCDLTYFGRICTPRPRSPICGTWSGSTTTSGSSRCSSTASWTLPAAPSTPTPRHPAMGCACAARYQVGPTACHERNPR